MEVPSSSGEKLGPDIFSASDSSVSTEAVIWAYRLFLGREPESDAVIESHRKHRSIEDLRKFFTKAPAFTAFMLEQTKKAPYAAPLWLLRPPNNPAISWNWGEPNLMEPVSQLCTNEQMAGSIYTNICSRLGIPPRKHRKAWEFAYIYAALGYHGVLKEGANLLGFGVGRENLPSAFARAGAKVVASDAPLAAIEGAGWQINNVHNQTLDNLYRPDVVDFEMFKKNVQFRQIDMNFIPRDLVEFDGCWSSCALEHLGGIEAGLKFIENSVETLKSGGIAVHTTEFNASSNDDTVNSTILCLFRRRDIETLIERLISRGHTVMPLNLYPGRSELDAYIDTPPYSQTNHIKLLLSSYVSTSIGLIIRRGL